MREKVMSLSDAVAMVTDGATVALGGNTLHRGPCAAVHELVRQGKRGLEVVKTAGSYDIDVLAGAGVASGVSAGYVGFETVFGMAPGYRRAVERGRVEAREHACYSVIAGLRAAIQGVPFMPIAGMDGSDVPGARGFEWVANPYGDGQVVVIPALIPDVAIVHAQEADALGNARIVGTRFEDVLMANAARRVIVTAERLVDGEAFAAAPGTVAIPAFVVDAVVEAPNGAWPTSCAGHYDFDAAYLAAYVQSAADEEAYRRFIEERIGGPVLAGAAA